MRTDTHRLAGTLVAVGFLAGWFAASWVSPPTAATQAGPPRTVTARPDVPLPRIALEAVTAPVTTPLNARNPFTFSSRREDALVESGRGERVDVAAAPEAEVTPAAPEPATPSWRVFGIAVEADGHLTAVVSGGGDVWLLGLDDRLPDGSLVVEIDATGVVLSRADGERLALRLP